MCVSSAISSVVSFVAFDLPLAISPIVANRIRKLPWPFSLTTADTDGTTVAAIADPMALSAAPFSFSDLSVALRLPPQLMLLSPGNIVIDAPCPSDASADLAAASHFFLFRTIKYKILTKNIKKYYIVGIFCILVNRS